MLVCIFWCLIGIQSLDDWIFPAWQNEWEKYLEENDCKQGDLSDPMYFDFISAAQFATVTQLMGEGKLIFEERTGAEGTVSVVSRDASLQNDEVLPAAFFRIAGDKMFAGLMANFTGENFYTQPPQPTAAGAPDSDVVAGLSLLYKKMVELGYALEVKVNVDTAVPTQQYLQEAGILKSFANNYGASGAVVETKAASSGTRVSFTLKAPATLWGRQWLGMQEYLHTDHGQLYFYVAWPPAALVPPVFGRHARIIVCHVMCVCPASSLDR